MQQFNYPTTILYGEGALEALAKRLAAAGIRRPLLVTDATLVKMGLAAEVEKTLGNMGVASVIFDATHPNPLEADVEQGVTAYQTEHCDGLVALGGGSPIDVAKVIRFMVRHPGPLSQYDDAKGGDQRIRYPLPPLSAIPTTAGTGSEVGRSGVIVMRDTGKKTIFFHPGLMPDFAVLEPRLTIGLPSAITAATGIDALTHCLEAYWVPAFHPLADGIALEGIRLVLKHLSVATIEGHNLEARGAMQMAAAMGATAFQKGLGMIHSLAHPLSARYNTHHGLANALLLPATVAFHESLSLSGEARAKLERVQNLFREAGLAKSRLSESCRDFFQSLGIQLGLRHHRIPETDLEMLAQDAMEDSCHATNMIPVTRENMLAAYQAAF